MTLLHKRHIVKTTYFSLRGGTYLLPLFIGLPLRSLLGN